MEEVYIRIKSPSSALPDLQINCDINQTVLYVKERIEERYETRPAPADQKLVYSGKLLQDRQLLKEFLRFEDECSVFTIHLVCKLSSPSPPSPDPAPCEPPPSRHDGVRNRTQLSGLRDIVDLPSQPAPGAEPTGIEELESIRAILDSMAGSPATLSQTEADNIQELYTQYINLYNQYLHTPEQEPRREPTNIAPAPPVPAPQVAGAPGEDAEPGNNDILDYAYAVIRVLILLCVVYAHSNFFRLLFVVGGMGLIYLLQARARGNQEGNQDNPEMNNNQDANINPEIINEELNPGEGRDEDEEEEEDGTGPKPNILMVAFSFLTSLITSIIPDHTNLI